MSDTAALVYVVDDDVSARDRSQGSSPLRIETRPSQGHAGQLRYQEEVRFSIPPTRAGGTSALPTTETNIPTPGTNHRLF